MNEEERKKRFIDLLSALLADHSGIKIKLADRLKIKPPTLTRWFQGKVDPATLDLAVFVRVAEVANRSIDDLAFFLGVVENSEEKILDNFKSFIQDLLSGQSHESLAKKLGISDGAVAGWVRSQRKVDPRRVAVSTIAGLAKEKAWTIERLLTYLGLKEIQTEKDLFFNLQSGAAVLSLNDRVRLLAWLSDLVQKEVIQGQGIGKFAAKLSDRTLIIILEQEDLAIGDTDLSLAQRATNYATNLAVNLELQPDNIQVASIKNLPESLEEFDLLLFDISSSESEAIALIEEIEFNGNIIVFAPNDLPSEVMANLSARVSDVVVKPVDWGSLKDKEYFR
ncbi:MAG: hypothetical protein QNJ38_18820 [Prochloraceae cyanobacterium]|nr:hypothetical protein [Prochloraceae cyanobacterium]